MNDPRLRRLARHRLGGVGFGLLAAFLAGDMTARSQERSSDRDRRAAWIVQVGLHVEWPSGAFGSDTAPIVVCFLGAGSDRKRLAEALGDKKAGKRTFEVRDAGSGDAIPSCHVLYIAGGHEQHLDQALGSIKDRPVMVIGESEGLAKKGATLNLVSSGDRIQPEASLAAAKQAGIKIGAKLLQLCTLID